jgi:hypothetical protein
MAFSFIINELDFRLILFLNCNLILLSISYTENYFQETNSKSMKKIIYALILSLVIISGLVFANRENSIKSIPKPLSATESKAELKKWEKSPEGVMFKKWEESPVGKKVNAGAAKISKSIRDYTDMKAVVTSLSLPLGSKLGFGVMVNINGYNYILAFGPDINKEFEQLQTLKVNDKIIIRSHYVSMAPKYSYPIIAGNFVQRDGKIIYYHAARKGGC